MIVRQSRSRPTPGMSQGFQILNSMNSCTSSLVIMFFYLFFSYIFAAIFEDPETYAQRIMGLAGGVHSVQEYCDILNKHMAPLVFKVR